MEIIDSGIVICLSDECFLVSWVWVVVFVILVIFMVILPILHK